MGATKYMLSNKKLYGKGDYKMGKGRKERTKERNKEKEEHLASLKEELAQNESTLKKNLEDPKGQIQIGLRGAGMPQGSMMYDSLIAQMKLDIEEEKMRNDSGFVLLNPSFEFQKSDRWREMQMIRSDKALKNMESNLEEVEKRVAEVEKAVADQTIRLTNRNPQIVEELKTLEQNAKDQNYIG